jgi:peptidoglycan/LPS O-acetylase OafA/YrhL
MQIRGDAERSAWRWPAAAAALVAVAAHIPITPTHLREAPYIGWSFVALEITLTALAVALVLRDNRLVWWAAGVVPATAMLAFAVTRSVALPQIGDDVGDWTQPLGLVALTAEGLLILIALGRHARHHPARWLARRPVLWAGLLLVAGLVATDYAVAVGGTG